MKKPSSHAGVKAFTRIELAVTVFALGLIAGLIILSGCQTMRESRSEACRNNLRMVGIAFRIWTPHPLGTYSMRMPKGQGGTRELIETGQVFVHFCVLSNELQTPKILVCPADKLKTVAANFNEGFSDANISYFVGLDADESYPQMFLSGDRNLAAKGQLLGKGVFIVTTNTLLSWSTSIHNSRGNICFADGSVQFLTSDGLARANHKQEVATNRLVLP